MTNKDNKKEHDKDKENTPRPCSRCGEPGCFPGRCIKPPKPGDNFAQSILLLIQKWYVLI
jgi:hypothetical protein